MANERSFKKIHYELRYARKTRKLSETLLR